MAVEVLYDFARGAGCDLLGTVVRETKLCGIVNNCPLRRRVVPFESIDIFANNDRQLRVVATDPNLNVVDITGATGVFTVKYAKDDATPTIQKSTAVPAEGMIGAADEGEMFFFLVPSDTDSLDICQYIFDVRLTLSDGKTYTIVEGLMNLLQPVN